MAHPGTGGPSPELIQAIAEYIRRGGSHRGAAAAAGIPWPTLATWCRRDETVATLIAQADAEIEQTCVASVLRAVTGCEEQKVTQDWRAASWWLERRRRREYGNELNVRALPVEVLRDLAGEQLDDYELPSITAADVIDAEFSSADDTATVPVEAPSSPTDAP